MALRYKRFPPTPHPPTSTLKKGKERNLGWAIWNQLKALETSPWPSPLLITPSIKWQKYPYYLEDPFNQCLESLSSLFCFPLNCWRSWCFGRALRTQCYRLNKLNWLNRQWSGEKNMYKNIFQLYVQRIVTQIPFVVELFSNIMTYISKTKLFHLFLPFFVVFKGNHPH